MLTFPHLRRYGTASGAKLNDVEPPQQRRVLAAQIGVHGTKVFHSARLIVVGTVCGQIYCRERYGRCRADARGEWRHYVELWLRRGVPHEQRQCGRRHQKEHGKAARHHRCDRVSERSETHSHASLTMVFCEKNCAEMPRQPRPACFRRT